MNSDHLNHKCVFYVGEIDGDLISNYDTNFK